MGEISGQHAHFVLTIADRDGAAQIAGGDAVGGLGHLAERGGDVARDDDAGQGGEHHDGERAEQDGPFGVSRVGLRLVHALLERRLLVALHLAQNVADLVHVDLPFSGQAELHGGLQAPGPPGLDHVMRELKAGGDERLQGVEAFLLARVVRQQRTELPHGPVQAGQRALVELQIGFFPGDDIAALAGLDVRQQGPHLRELRDDLVGVLARLRRFNQPGGAPVGNRADDHEDRERDAKPGADLGSDVPFHGDVSPVRFCWGLRFPPRRGR